MPAAARSRPRVEARGAAVFVNKRIVLHFLVANGALSPAERAHVVVERLQAQAGRGLLPSAVQVRREGKQWRVVLAGRASLFLVTRQDARKSRSLPKALAFRWAGQLRSALAAPPVTLSAARLVVPIGESRLLRLGGYEEGAFASRVDGDECLGLESRAESRQVLVRGVKTGKAIVRVRIEGSEARCVVLVKKYAGRVPTSLTAEVTGTPSAPADLITAVAASTLRQAPREPGATLKLLSPLRARSTTAPDESQTLTAQVRLEGAGYLPVTGTARVRVFNRALSAQQATRLFYSNAPEHITHAGTLYASMLRDDQPARVMFHHDNQQNGAVVFGVTLSNPTDAPLRIHLIPGFVTPGYDPASVGYRAGQVFFRHSLKQQGEICVLPPRSVLPLVVQRLRRHQTASGIAQVTLIEPSEEARCQIKIEAFPAGGIGFPRSAQNALDPWRHTTARPMTQAEYAALDRNESAHPTYLATRAVEARHIAGQRWTFLPLGPAVQSASTKMHSREVDGDYGVLYDIRVHLENPLPTKQKIEVAFEPSGGPAMAVFSIGGRYLELKETRPPHERSVAQFMLQPNEKRVITIQTVPLGGSTYPANLIVK